MTLPAWPAPAKLNLFLHVIGRRSDGYHNLQTVFQFLDYCDYLTFDVTTTPAICRVNAVPGVAENDDLVCRAALLLQQSAGVNRGVRIGVDKRLPMGGGLGGGSSDAATTLVALNRLWGLELPHDKLAELGLRLGADVPVFVRGQSAWAEGIGEHLTPLPDMATPWYLVVKPDCSVSTAEIFRASELTRDTVPIRIRDFLAGHEGHNDCTPVVRARYPAVARALDWLGQYGVSRLTGTGACVFATFASANAAAAALSKLPSPWQGFVAKGLNRSPLCERLSAAG